MFFPVGFLNFSVAGVNSGGAVAVTCIFHAPFRYTNVFGFGPTGDSNASKWYDFDYNGRTGTTPGKAGLVLRFVHGSRGDHDTQNGRVTAAVGPAAPGTAQLLNISTRVHVGTGENALIGGFIVTSTEPKKVIIRAIGPSHSARRASPARCKTRSSSS